MNISKSGIELIKRFEGLRLKAYQDSVGIWTIGYGWTQPVDGKKVGPGMQIDQATADCSGQLKLATALEFFQYRFSDSFGGNPPL
ncbi:hypothetical protein AI2618V1_2189 [Serratia marcescens]|nr:hypothetical protein AI2618V1_2189 [Serratia marcescens]CAE7304550.1 hypothetical protein AI2617V1_2183 [Serratia marcescens]CAH3679721.1 hypothetical protein AI2618V1_2189 [Serratia marcescens]CAH3963969.1 hypothetical protein AI2617V1_2183 [Serratia marcescens]CAI1559416.1 Phage-related lysozyme (muraminidase) [Serratia marcescens]